eukprot:3034268-Rhodomonas_salina.1
MDFSLTLRLCEGAQLQNNQLYSLSFQVVNPREEQESPAVSISASSQVDFPLVAMSKVDNPVDGVLGGSKPLLVIIPKFSQLEVVQTVPVVNTSNLIVFSVRINVNLAAADNSEITISGLRGASLAQSANGTQSFGLSGPASNKLCSVGPYLPETVVLRVCDGLIFEGSQTQVFTLMLMNPAQEQIAPTLAIEASGSVTIPSTVIPRQAQ